MSLKSRRRLLLRGKGGKIAAGSKKRRKRKDGGTENMPSYVEEKENARMLNNL